MKGGVNDMEAPGAAGRPFITEDYCNQRSVGQSATPAAIYIPNNTLF
jgi:hypothetical protein